MSWFSELTGKAGALLDKMDQAAAVSLQDAGVATPSSNSRNQNTTSKDVNKAAPYEPTTYQSLTTPSERGAAVAQVLVGSASGSAQLTSTPKPQIKHAVGTGGSLKTERKQKNTDDSIFEFLNTPSERSSSRTSVHKPPQAQTTPSLPSSSSLPNITKVPSQFERNNLPPRRSHTPVEPKVEKDEGKISFILQEGEGEEEVIEKEVRKEEVDGEVAKDRLEDSQPAKLEVSSVVTEPPPVQQAELEEWKQKVSNLKLENKLMKREVSSLNEELSAVMLRVNEASSSKSQYENEIHTLREHISGADRTIRQLRSHEEDLQASVEARDSQIEVLRTQLSAADRALNAANERVALSKKEHERLLQDVNLSSGAQNQAMESLKTQLSQAQAQLAQDREEYQSERRNFVEKESLLRLEQTKLSDNVAVMQRQVMAEQSRSRDFQAALQSTQRDIQILRKEHEDYKQKATGILQAKEKLISALQHSEGSVGVAGEARLEEVWLEKEHLQAQLTNTLNQLERVRKDMQNLEEKSSSDMDGALEQIRVCEGVLAEEKKQHASTREEMVQLNQELDMIREDLVKERTKHREDVDTKETEIADLKLRMTSLTPGRVELESRLHELTESLIQKQTTLETLNSEKSTLNVQLQRLQGELAQAQRSKVKAPHTSIQVNGLEHSGGSEGAQVQTMSSVIPSLDGAPSGTRLHNVRRAVNTVDRISIRLGTFLKRYPQARLFTLIYMLLLHVWVMVVMLTYSPEMHDIDDPKFHPGM